MDAPSRILVVDDDATTLDAVALGLESMGFQVDTRSAAADALEAVREEEFDLVLTDVQMDGMDGLTLCERLADERADLPVIVMTGHASMAVAIRAIRVGAYDFLTKPIDLEALELQVRRALDYAQLSAEVRRLRRVVAVGELPELVGESAAMQAVKELIRRVAATDVGVLILGESGTGKEVAARAIHDLSGRSDGAFVAVNCAALPENLLESELFGHARGAFTDAKQARRGLFLEADGGTLLLDEIGEMPIAMQVKLLRALQERQVRPVGADRSVAFDTRIIAATNRDLKEAIEEGDFREDLYYRLNVVQLDLPPLRARGNDALLLAHAFVARFAERHKVPVAGIAPEAAEKIRSYDWPGNVRELMNAVERAVALARYDHVQVADLPEQVRDHTPTRLTFVPRDIDSFIPLEEVERRYLLQALEACGGNKSQAAQILGIDRKTLHRKLSRWAADGLGPGGDDDEG